MVKELRSVAESVEPRDLDALSSEEIAYLIYDLEAHKMELELENQELRARQLELSTASTAYRELYEAAPVAYLTLDKSGAITGANLRASTLLGRDRDLLVGLPLALFLNQKSAEELYRTRLSISDHSASGYEWQLRDGRYVGVICRLRRDRNGPRLLIALSDITEKKLQQIEMAEREAKLRAILATTIDGILTFDRDGIIDTFNPAAQMIFGQPSEYVIGRDLRMLIAPRSHEALGEVLARSQDCAGFPPDAPGQRNELWGLRQNGSVFPIEISVGAVDDWSVAVIRDLSWTRRLEAEIREAHKIEAIGRLASGIAHYFNNLLMGLRGCAEMAEAEVAADGRARELLDEIRRAADGGAAIIRHLLTFSRESEGELHPAPIDRLVEASAPLLTRLLGEDIELKMQLGSGDTRVHVEDGQIDQIIVNLAANARDAMPKGGALTIRTALHGLSEPEAAVRRKKAGQYVVLTVADSGEGMSAHTRERAFEPFFTTKQVGEAAGLGLSSVYGIAERNHGFVDLHSAPGEGTTVDVWIPAADTPEQPAERAADSRALRILIVEDERLVRMTVRHYVESAGFEVIEAADAAEARSCCQELDALDLLLTDIVLPGASGPALAREITRRFPEVRIAYMSAHPRSTLLRAGRIKPDDVLVHKPFDRDKLLAEIERILER